MGSLVVKLDAPTREKLENRWFYSDIDMLTTRGKKMNENDIVVDDVPMVYDVDAVKASIRNILMWRVGENVIRPEFGHNIHRSMYEQMNEFNKDKVCEEIKRAIEENESRVQVESVAVKPQEEDSENRSALLVKVIYQVIGNKADGAKMMLETSITSN